MAYASRPVRGSVRPTGFIGPKRSDSRPAPRHLFRRHAALEVRHRVELVRRGLIGRRERVEERLVLLARHRAVEVRAVALAFHRLLAVARRAEDDVVIDGVVRDDRRDRVVERQRLHAEPRANGGGERVGGERPGRDDAGRRQRNGLLAHDGDARMRRDASCTHGRGKDVAVDGERAAAGHARFVGALEDHAAEQAHLGLQQAVRVRRLGALEGVGADELGEAIGLVRLGAAHGPHLVQHDVVPALGELPGGFAAGEAAADDGGTSHSLPHLRHFRKSPRALVNFISAPTYAHSGHVSATGLFHATKSHVSFEHA